MPPRRDNWIDEDEYPDDKDIDAFGDYSEYDDDPRTIGYVGHQREGFWTKGRIFLLIIVAILVISMVLPPLLSISRQ